MKGWLFLLTYFSLTVNNIFPAFMSLVYMTLFTALLIIASISDLKRRIIPDRLILAGLLAALLFKFIQLLSGCQELLIYPSLKSMFAGLFLGASPLIFLNIISFLREKWDKNKAYIGGGDIKLMAMAGFYLGSRAVMASYVYTSLATLLVLPLLLILGKIKRKDFIPFGPFLSFGLWAAMLADAL